MKEFEKLFNETRKTLEKSDLSKGESRQRGEQFNLFRICGVNHYETTHSAILAELLNPKGSHGQKDTFLSMFLKDTGLENFCFDTSTAVIRTEYSMEYGRIDILISNKDGKAVIIENKIYAADQYKQLMRYQEFALRNYGNGNFRILYLTLNGHYASIQSGNGVGYINISYRNEILKWIDNCISYCVSKPIIRETLIQYSNLIKELTNQDMEARYTEELLNIMANNAKEVAEIYNHFHKYREFVLDKYLKPQLEELAKELNMEFESNWSADRYKGFSMKRKEWKKCRILFQSQSYNYNNYIYGISCNRDEEVLEHGKLNCLQKFNNNKWWQMGFSVLKYNMDVNTMRDITTGTFVKYIRGCVTSILDELDERGIILP